MANSKQGAPRRQRRLRDPSKPLPRPFKRKGPVEEKKRRKAKRKHKKGKGVVGVDRREGKEERREEQWEEEEEGGDVDRADLSASSSFLLSTVPPAQQLRFFLKQFESAMEFKMSSLERDAIKDTCIVKLPEGINQDVDNFCKHMKDTFGISWKQVLCEGKLLEGKVVAGSPAVLIITTSASRSLELLRGLRPLTRECHPLKLFAKHIKVDDQVSLLKNRVNIACGTPSRIKKLMDMEALGTSRLSLIVLDMQADAKCFSLFTLPQVRNDFWDLYQSHFHQRLIQGDLRICLYGPTSVLEFEKTERRDEL
uniref:Uncharacterized protein C3orf26 n=1 Tax=Anthurium amnicola TaxID=1678845 RepID=A0A1D1Y8P1_9ARAE